MVEKKLSRRQLLKTAGVLGAAAAVFDPIKVFADEGEATVRWDIINVDFLTGTLTAGGHASASAAGGSKITLTGSGTFRQADAVTGGGTWKTFNSGGTQTGGGTYEVTRLVSWQPAPGTPPLPHDGISDREDESAGLAVLQIRYSDGSRGVLTVSCDLVGTPEGVFEGITTTKGFVDYWNREAPMPGVNANRTNFHVMDKD